jgi:hypothetical protein
VTEQSAVSVGKYGGEPAAVAGEALVADGVDAAMQWMEMSRFEPAPYRVRTNSMG